MKSIKYQLLFLISLIVISSSGSSNIYSQENRSGSNSEFKNVEIIKPTIGFLRIENQWDMVYKDIFEVKYYLPYKIYDPEGKLIAKISGSKMVPQTVRLSEGLYYIKINKDGLNKTKFGVEIEAGKTTLIE